MFYIFFTGPSALVTVNIINNKSFVIDVHWDAADPSLATNYTVTWTSETEPTLSYATTHNTSYTITGLTLDTVYNITVAGANMCGQGPGFSTSVSISTGLCHFYYFWH